MTSKCITLAEKKASSHVVIFSLKLLSGIANVSNENVALESEIQNEDAPEVESKDWQ